MPDAIPFTFHEGSAQVSAPSNGVASLTAVLRDVTTGVVKTRAHSTARHSSRWRHDVRAAALGVLVSVLVVGSAALISSPSGVARTNVPSASTSASTSLSHAPIGLQRAVLNTPSIARTLHETKAPGLRVSYSAHALRLSAGHQSATVGVATFGRGASVRAIGDMVHSTSAGATYVARGATERLVRTSTGLEQSFLITSRPNGAGNLHIAIPLGDVAATGRGSSLTLIGVGGRSVGSYSGLVVRDANGHLVPSTMSYSSATHQVIINIADAHATYPLRVDPTWSIVGSEITDPGATSNDDFGVTVSVSGTNAVVGADGDSVNAGAVYFYSLVSGVWTLNTASGTSGEITGPAPTSDDEFGYAVAISGTNAVVGAYGVSSQEGAVYFYSLISGVWTLNTASGTGGEITDPAAANFDRFGYAVAIDGTNAVVGADGANGQNGAIYFYGLVSGVWTLNTASGTGGEINDPGAVPGDNFGYSVAISGTNAVVGAAGASSQKGAAYFYSLSSGVWTLNTASGTGGEIIDPAATNNDEFGYSVAISGTNAVVGADGNNAYAGAIYFYSLSSSVWTLSTASGTGGEVDDPAATSNDEFGAAVAIDGTNAAAGASGVNSGAGAAYFSNTPTVSSAPVTSVPAVQTDTVSFNAEGGSPVAAISGNDGSIVLLPTPTFAGHTFLGWFTSSTGGSQAYLDLALTSPSTTLYAQWSTIAATPATSSTTTSYHLIGAIRSFALGSSVLTTSLKAQIQHVATLIESRHLRDVLLNGNATSPVSASNLSLARARAIAVENYLVQLGVHAKFSTGYTVSGTTSFYLEVSVTAK